MIDYAQNMRRYMALSASYESKVLLTDRYDAYIIDVQEDCSNMGNTQTRFAEQHYDLMLELNNYLIEFCQVRTSV